MFLGFSDKTPASITAQSNFVQDLLILCILFFHHDGWEQVGYYELSSICWQITCLDASFSHVEKLKQVLVSCGKRLTLLISFISWMVRNDVKSLWLYKLLEENIAHEYKFEELCSTYRRYISYCTSYLHFQKPHLNVALNLCQSMKRSLCIVMSYFN